MHTPWGPRAASQAPWSALLTIKARELIRPQFDRGSPLSLVGVKMARSRNSTGARSSRGRCGRGWSACHARPPLRTAPGEPLSLSRGGCRAASRSHLTRAGSRRWVLTPYVILSTHWECSGSSRAPACDSGGRAGEGQWAPEMPTHSPGSPPCARGIVLAPGTRPQIIRAVAFPPPSSTPLCRGSDCTILHALV